MVRSGPSSVQPRSWRKRSGDCAGPCTCGQRRAIHPGYQASRIRVLLQRFANARSEVPFHSRTRVQGSMYLNSQPVSLANTSMRRVRSRESCNRERPFLRRVAGSFRFLSASPHSGQSRWPKVLPISVAKSRRELYGTRRVRAQKLIRNQELVRVPRVIGGFVQSLSALSNFGENVLCELKEFRKLRSEGEKRSCASES